MEVNITIDELKSLMRAQVLVANTSNISTSDVENISSLIDKAKANLVLELQEFKKTCMDIELAQRHIGSLLFSLGQEPEEGSSPAALLEKIEEKAKEILNTAAASPQQTFYEFLESTMSAPKSYETPEKEG